MVAQDWPEAEWYPLWIRMCKKLSLFREPVYLDQSGEPWKHPGWNKKIAILDGKRVTNTNVTHTIPIQITSLLHDPQGAC